MISLNLTEDKLKCLVCDHDLCNAIFMCGNGLHHYCATCIEKIPPKRRQRQHDDHPNIPEFLQFLMEDSLPGLPAVFSIGSSSTSSSSLDFSELMQQLDTHPLNNNESDSSGDNEDPQRQ